MIHGLKPAVMMVVVQIAFAGVNVFYKLAINVGMSLRVIIAYRFLFAAAFMIPVAIVFERKHRPKFTWKILFQGFLCGLFGCSLAQNLYLASIALTSATFAAAMFNLVPAITFILAVTFGLERVGKVKVLGTLLGIVGAMVLTFYKGPKVDLWSTRVDLLKHGGHVASSPSSSPHHSHGHALGSLMSVGSCISYAGWLIIQAKMSKSFPYPYSSTALMCSMASIQAIVFALCMERDWSQWKLGWNIRLFSVTYAGIVGSGMTVALMTWCVRMRGPLFVSIFNPLMLLLVALAASLLLDEQLHLGSIIGGALIVLGLYVVLWAKSKELKKLKQLPMPSKNSTSSSNNSSNSSSRVNEVENLQIVVTSPSQTTCNSNGDSAKTVVEAEAESKSESEEKVNGQG